MWKTYFPFPVSIFPNEFNFLALRYIQCIHQKLYHLTQSDYEEFASIILAARAAFQITPEGNAQFKDWLQSIKRLVFKLFIYILF